MKVCPTCGDTDRVSYVKWDEQAGGVVQYWGPCPVCAGRHDPIDAPLPGFTLEETRRLQFMRWSRLRERALR